jgi:hypothetical protein
MIRLRNTIICYIIVVHGAREDDGGGLRRIRHEGAREAAVVQAPELAEGQIGERDPERESEALGDLQEIGEVTHGQVGEEVVVKDVFRQLAGEVVYAKGNRGFRGGVCLRLIFIRWIYRNYLSRWIYRNYLSFFWDRIVKP